MSDTTRTSDRETNDLMAVAFEQGRDSEAARRAGERREKPNLYPDLCDYDGLDPGIREAVRVLRTVGVETFESCEGGPGHSYPEPTVRFHGEPGEGFRALAAVMCAGLSVRALRRSWDVFRFEPDGPYWELTFKLPLVR